MSAAVTIRHATDADAPALARLLGELGYALDAEEVPARVERFRAQGNGEVIVALLAGAVIGFAAVAITFPIHHARPVVHLSAFAVASGTRRQGVGRSLLAAVEDHARQAGCARVVVGSAERRADAHAFYLAAGWPYRGRRFGKDLDQA